VVCVNECDLVNLNHEEAYDHWGGGAGGPGEKILRKKLYSTSLKIHATPLKQKDELGYIL